MSSAVKGVFIAGLNDKSHRDAGKEAPHVLPNSGLGDQLAAIARKYQITYEEIETVQANIRRLRSPVGPSPVK